jgi:hypothetical protein
MPPSKAALRRRINPCVELTLETGEGRTEAFKLSFNYNAFALIEDEVGSSPLDGPSFWLSMTAKKLRATLWAAVILNHPEYDSREGLLVIGSYMDPSNTDQIATALFDAYVAGLSKENQEKLRQAKRLAEEEERTGRPIEAQPSPGPDSTGASIGPPQNTTSDSLTTNSAGST